MRKLKEIREARKELLRKYHDEDNILEAEEKAAFLRRQKRCPHPEDRIRQQADPYSGYFEQGKMSAPLPTTYQKVCGRCKLVLARQQVHTVTKWIEP